MAHHCQGPNALATHVAICARVKRLAAAVVGEHTSPGIQVVGLRRAQGVISEDGCGSDKRENGVAEKAID